MKTHTIFAAVITAALLCISAVIVPLFRSAEAAVSSIGTSCVFIKTLIPVLAGLITASGKPSLALSFQSWGFTAAQVISALSESYIMPAVGAVLALDITGSLMPSFKLSGITELIKKTVAWFEESRDHNHIFEFHHEKDNCDVYTVALRDATGRLIGYYEKHEYRCPETAQPFDFGNDREPINK